MTLCCYMQIIYHSKYSQWPAVKSEVRGLNLWVSRRLAFYKRYMAYFALLPLLRIKLVQKVRNNAASNGPITKPLMPIRDRPPRVENSTM